MHVAPKLAVIGHFEYRIVVEAEGPSLFESVDWLQHAVADGVVENDIHCHFGFRSDEAGSVAMQHRRVTRHRMGAAYRDHTASAMSVRGKVERALELVGLNAHEK